MKKSGMQILLNVIFYLGVMALIAAVISPYFDFLPASNPILPFNRGLNHHSVTLKKGDTVRIYPNKFYKKVTYRSSDFKVAEVNSTGRVRAKRKGTAIIKVTAGKKVWKCKVTVIHK